MTTHRQRHREMIGRVLVVEIELTLLRVKRYEFSESSNNSADIASGFAPACDLTAQEAVESLRFPFVVPVPILILRRHSLRGLSWQ